MVKVIMGKKGTGKTKMIIDMVNTAVKEENGNVVCIEGGRKLTYDISYDVRLVDLNDYPGVNGYDELYAFIVGMYSMNFDVTHVFVDSLYKIAGSNDADAATKFLDKLSAFSDKNDIKYTIMISDDLANSTEGMQKYL